MNSNVDVLKAKLYFLLIALTLLPLPALSQLSPLLLCEHQPLKELLSVWGQPFKASASPHSCVVRAARWFINPQSRYKQAIALVQSPVKNSTRQSSHRKAQIGPRGSAAQQVQVRKVILIQARCINLSHKATSCAFESPGVS